MALIELKDICKTYYIGRGLPVPALKSTSLTIEAGEFVAIMGPSGSGKSTLLAVLGLLDRPDCGTYRLFGREITQLNEVEYASLRGQHLGFIFQMFNLLPRFTVADNAFLPFLYTVSNPADRERVIGLLKQIGLGDRLDHRPNELSGGQQQRVAVARALANQPPLIFADEPTGNLDSKSAHEIMGILKDLNAQGTTVIMVTHERELAETASRIISLRDGVIISDERIRETAKNVSVQERKLKRTSSLSFASVLNYSREAIQSLFANKLRSLLSILGVLIGVGAVITMLAIGTGAQKQVQDSLSAMGSNVLMVSTSFRNRGISLGSDSVTRFTFEDLTALQKMDSVKYVVPYVSGRVQVVYADKNWNTQVMGCNNAYQYVRNAVPASGRFFTDGETASRAKVAVLGQAVVDEIFGQTNPVGKQIRINKINFIVIGVLPVKGTQGFRNLDDQILVPITTAMYRVFGRDYINNFDVQAVDGADLNQVQADIVPILIKTHRLTDAQSENFDVRNMADLQKATSDVVNTFAFLLGSIAAVSLLVGGIGIMNIMLVMVMERTHEIGLRKALGAENRDIMLQFLVESVLVCTLGGILGILFGIGAANLISTIAGWNILVTMQSLLLSFSFSVLVGLIFGLWPAWRAAKLLPIVALRYE